MKGAVKPTAHGGQFARSVGSPEVLVARMMAPERTNRRIELKVNILISDEDLNWFYYPSMVNRKSVLVQANGDKTTLFMSRFLVAKI